METKAKTSNLWSGIKNLVSGSRDDARIENAVNGAKNKVHGKDWTPLDHKAYNVYRRQNGSGATREKFEALPAEEKKSYYETAELMGQAPVGGGGTLAAADRFTGSSEVTQRPERNKTDIAGLLGSMTEALG